MAARASGSCEVRGDFSGGIGVCGVGCVGGGDGGGAAARVIRNLAVVVVVVENDT